MLRHENLHPAKDILAELHEEISQALGQQALHEIVVERAVLGLFFSGVQLSSGAGGLCATPLKSIPAAVCCPSSALAMPLPGKLTGRSAADLLEDLHRPQDLRRTLAIATLNALAETLWQRDGPPSGVAVHEGDAFDALHIQPHEHVVLVGAFPPYMRSLRRSGQSFQVLELDMSTLKPEERPFHVPPEHAAPAMAQADVVLCTGTTLVNRTLDELLQPLKAGARVAVVGPTATLLPGPFTRRGVTVVGGVRVSDPDTLLDFLAEGASGYHLFGHCAQRICLSKAAP